MTEWQEPHLPCVAAMQIAWDPLKALANAHKHGVTFDEAATVFGDPLAKVLPDPRHSYAEERLVLLGLSSRGRLLAVMFSESHPDVIRIYSARHATKYERRNYEENT
jgi:uncharacterized protein